MKNAKKIIATLLASMLMSMNLLSIGSEVIAVSEELANQNEKTNHANVEFNIYFEGGSYQKEFEIGKEANLILSLEVKNNGYLRNGIVEFSDGNYKIDISNLTSEKIQSASENQIKLNQVNTSDGKILITVPILLSEKDTVSSDYLRKQTEVKLTASYIDGSGKERQIEKSIFNQAVWTISAELEVNTELNKFLPYQIGNSYGVMLQAKVVSKVKDNTIPVKNTQITINAPIFNVENQVEQQTEQVATQSSTTQEVKPSKVTVITNMTKATNGKTSGVEFTENNYTYDAENNQVVIQVENQEENGQIAWAKQAQDEYIVSYFYEGKEIYDYLTASLNSIQKVSGKFDTTVKCQLYDETQSKIEKTIQTPYSLEEISENFNDYEMNYTQEISKGYFYANEIKSEKEAQGQEIEEKQETSYQIIYRAKIINKELVKAISFTSQSEKLEGREQYVANADTKTILIPENIFNKILGEDGKVEVFKTDNTKVGEITKATTKDEKGNYVLDISDQNVNEIFIKTSKPVAEGEFALKLTKALKTEQTITKVQMQNVTKMTIGVTASSNDEKSLEGKISLVEPITKAELIIDEGKQTLSTVTENKDIEMKIVLDTSSTVYALYKNPTFEIELPSYIEKVTLKDVNLLLDDELKIKDKRVVSKNGKQVITITLEGTQSKYFHRNTEQEENQNVITKGANIVIRADMLVKKLTPSRTENINLYYTNENTDLYEKTYTGQTSNSTVQKVAARTISTQETETKGVATASITFVAPTGVTAATTITGYDEQGTELDNLTDEKKESTIPVYGEAKTLTITGTIMNNYENSIGNIAILGRIPFQGNKKIDETEDLGSTFTTKLLTDISFTGIDSSKVHIYYSENGEATKDLQNSQNEWKDELVNLAAVKSYLIVIDAATELAQAAQISFQYQVEVPVNLTHNQSSYQMYKVYYDNKTEDATISQTTMSGITGVTTGEGPELEVKLSASLPENTVARVGQYIRFYVEVKNTGKVDANNVKVKVALPTNTMQTEEGEKDISYVTFVDFEEYNNNYTPSTDMEKTITISQIKAGETKQVDYELLVSSGSGTEEGAEDQEETESNNQQETIIISNQVEVTADKLNGTIISNTYSLQLAEGNLKVTNKVSTVEALTYKQGDVITYKINLANYGYEDIKNIVVTVPLPKNAKIIENYAMDINKNKIDAEISSKENEITAKMGDILQGAEDKILVVQFELGEKEQDYFSTKVQVIANEIQTYYSNERFVSLVSNAIVTGNQITPSKVDVMEGEEFEYQFIIETQGDSRTTNFILEDTLPMEIKWIETTVEVLEIPDDTYNGASVTTIKDNLLTFKMEYIAPNTKLSVKFKVKGRLQDINEEKQIVNSATMYADGIEQTRLNSVTMYLHYNSDVHDTNEQTPTNSEKPNKYVITGTAWEDTNKNGNREEDEKLLEGIKVLLLYKANSQIVLDEDTNEQKITTTDSQGEYQFDNLLPDQYLVIFLYDSGKYSITEYQKQEVNVNTNNDAINMKITLNGEKTYAGVTDTIKITNSSQRNLDLGLYVAEKFDLRLDKYISKITLTTPTIGTKTYNYDNSKLEKIEVLGRNVNKSSAVIEYKIVVTNEGQVSGYVKKLIDYLPENTKFSSELNQNWYVSDSNRTVYNTSLENTKINPGESKEVSLILSLQITDQTIGSIINNNAEIYETYNEQGLIDIDSTEANALQQEDDMSKADIALSIVTGKIILYTTLGISIFAMIVIGTILIKKKVLMKKI